MIKSDHGKFTRHYVSAFSRGDIDVDLFLTKEFGWSDNFDQAAFFPTLQDAIDYAKFSKPVDLPKHTKVVRSVHCQTNGFDLGTIVE